MATRLGVSARVTVLSAAELALAVKENCVSFGNPSRMMVSFLNDPSDRKRLETLAREDWAPEILAVGKRVAYLWCPEGIIESRLANALAKLLGDAVTTRNWATVTKLNALAVAD